MTRLPLTNIVLLIGVLVLAAIQCMFSWQFWYSSAAEESHHALPFATFGVVAAIIELVLLTVATNAAVRGFPFNGWAARFVFVVVCAGNYMCDIAAITTFTSTDARHRQSAAVRYQDAEATAAELKVRIDKLHGDLANSGLDLPAAALRIQVEDMTRRAADGSVTEATRQWRQGERARREAALLVAEEIERLEQAREDARTQSVGQGAQPSPYPPYLESLVKALSWFGFVVEPEDARIAISIALATMMRLLLGFGVWFAVGPFAKTRRGDDARPRPKAGVDDFRKRALAAWPWPQSWSAPLKPSPQTSRHSPRSSGAGQPEPAAPPQHAPPSIIPAGRDGPRGESTGRKAQPQRRTVRKPPASQSNDGELDLLDDLDPVN